MNKIFLSIALIAVSVASVAVAVEQPIVDEGGCKAFTLEVAKAFAEKRTRDIYLMIQQHVADPTKVDVDQLSEALANQLRVIEKPTKEVGDVEYVGASKFGNVFVRMTCVVKYKSNPLLVNCTFYSFKGNWAFKSFTFKFDTDYDKVLAETFPEMWRPIRVIGETEEKREIP